MFPGDTRTRIRICDFGSRTHIACPMPWGPNKQPFFKEKCADADPASAGRVCHGGMIMPQATYEEAAKAGKKEIQAREAAGLPTMLPVLDEILSGAEIRGEVPLGLIDIPNERIVGTKTAARAVSFAPNFMPLLPEGSEFAMKWKNLCKSHLEEGIREPVSAYEYLNQFYVLEGNKRVSVLKFFGAPTIPAYVTRIIPAWEDTPEIRLYYEFLDFYNQTNFYDIECSGEGSYRRLCRLTGHRRGARWEMDDRIDFRSCYNLFSAAFRDLGGENLSCTVGDAFLVYLTVYGYDAAKGATAADFAANLKKIWEEIEIRQPNAEPEEKLNVKLDPAPEPKKTLLTQILPGTTSPKTVTRIAFVYYRNKEVSSWTYGHELGRQSMEDAFGGRVKTSVYDNVTPETVDATLEQAIADGSAIVFVTSPLFLSASIKAAAEHPDVKILNCSMNQVHKYIRTYYARIFEAKLLNGILAGILTDTGTIGYIADYPILTVPAAIDAFALGVRMVNPAAKVLLEWSTVQENVGIDLTRKLYEKGATYISHLDLIVPQHATREYGLYHVREDGQPDNLALPVLDWGKYYERIIRNVLHGTWKAEEKEEASKAVSYFWGMSSGVVDVIWSDQIPSATRNLLEMIKRSVMRYDFNPFCGTLHTQGGVIETAPWGLTTQEIIAIDWLADNVVGSIPAAAQMTSDTKPVVREEGVRPDGEDDE